MKLITFDGRIGANGAEVRTTRGGKPYVRFSVANNSFINSQEKTEWFDVTSYDPYIIENRVKSLTKGTYVIIQGELNTETNVKDNKVWLNQYVTATSINIPYLGKKSEDEQNVREIKEQISSDEEVSTYSAGSLQSGRDAGKEKASVKKEVQEPEQEEFEGDDEQGDDLPF